MRVIAGRYGGRRLASARKVDVRPATDRVRETIFNILQNRLSLRGATVLDVFAGTGSLGIEAISRGATNAVFVDNSERALKLLRLNISQLGCDEACTVVKADALHFVERCQEQFDLIFVDPPYAYEATTQFPELIFSRHLLKKNGFLIIEHSRKTSFAESSLFRRVLSREFGQTVVSFFAHPH